MNGTGLGQRDQAVRENTLVILGLGAAPVLAPRATSLDRRASRVSAAGGNGAAADTANTAKAASDAAR